MEAIILAGGFGTRLQGVIGPWPKSMAVINEKPFLDYLFSYLARQGCISVILSLGFRHDIITDWIATQAWPFQIQTVIESEPLGTGGGIQAALKAATHDHCLALNGDTFFDINLELLLGYHISVNAETTLALCPMTNFDRYGIVKTAGNGAVTLFEEKKRTLAGNINGGVYAISRKAFLNRHLPQKFSFEKDYLEAFVDDGKFFGQVCPAYFIDIGIPADYERAQTDFKALFSDATSGLRNS